MSLFAGVGGGGAGANPASTGGTGRALLELTPHKVAVCHLVQVFAPPGEIVTPFPFKFVTHYNRLGLFLFTLTRVPSHERLLACFLPTSKCCLLLMLLSLPCVRYMHFDWGKL
ncbi:unnamed protein product [Urochloa humidicola]